MIRFERLIMDRYIVTTNRPWESDIQFFNSYQEAKQYYDDNLGDRPTLAKVLEYNHDLFPELKTSKWMQEALIIWNSKNTQGHIAVDHWERIFQERYYDADKIETYQDELGWSKLFSKGRVLIYDKQSGFSIGMTKVVEK